jgi:uncharacterized protein
MHSVVFDVNVLVSSLIVEGKPEELWLEAKANKFVLISSRQIVSEFVKVISRKKFEKYVDEKDIRLFLEDLHKTAKFIPVKSKFEVVKEDPSDDVILRTAYDGKADYVISGDRHLLYLGVFRGIHIIAVAEVLNLLKNERG